MSDAEWDAEDFEPPKAAGAATTDKWDGEDSDDDVKDNWDDEEDEGNKNEENTTTETTKKKSTLKLRIAEREAKRKAEREAKLKADEEAQANLTPEEMAEDKARQLKLQEDADLELAREAFGVADGEEQKGVIDSFSPESREDFTNFAEVLKTKITKYEKSPHYSSFLDTLFRDLSIGLDSDELKKLGTTLNALANEKAKQLKAKGGKKKGKSAAKINPGREDNYDDYQAGAYDEFDDFI